MAHFGASRLPRRDHADAALAQPARKLFHLGGFAHTVEAFKSYEFSCERDHATDLITPCLLQVCWPQTSRKRVELAPARNQQLHCKEYSTRASSRLRLLSMGGL